MRLKISNDNLYLQQFILHYFRFFVRLVLHAVGLIVDVLDSVKNSFCNCCSIFGDSTPFRIKYSENRSLLCVSDFSVSLYSSTDATALICFSKKRQTKLEYIIYEYIV